MIWQRILERFGFVEPRLVAWYQQPVIWADRNDLRETITYFLKEYPSGRRVYDVHSYGYCAAYNTHRDFAAPAEGWVRGAGLPLNATRAVTPNGFKPRVIDGGAA